MRFLYLHGFASGPQSNKAQAFRRALEHAGISLEIPALDEGDFEHLTISRQLALIERTLANDPVCLTGSSMGGYLAALYASSHPEVCRLVMMAPAFGIAARWKERINEPKSGAFEVYHYADRAMRQVNYRLIEDALEFPAYPDFPQPALIFHGIHDDTVPVENSRTFAASHPNAWLIEVDSDHALLSVLEQIVAQSAEFLRECLPRHVDPRR